VIALPDPIFPTYIDIIHCCFTIHGGIFKEYNSCGQQVFDVPIVVETNKYIFVLICCVLQQ